MIILNGINMTIDFDALQQSVLEAAIQFLEDKDEVYAKAWIEGVNFTCYILNNLIEKKQNLENFNSMAVLNHEIH